MPVKKRKKNKKPPILPKLSDLEEAVLTNRQGSPLSAGTLWHDKPALVLILRRPGCIMCRTEARKLWALKGG
ncbi:hypothetical protein WJX84_004074, partial [Apatococcus fuscideae]